MDEALFFVGFRVCVPRTSRSSKPSMFAMCFTVPIKHVDSRHTGKPGTRGRLGSPVALTHVQYMISYCCTYECTCCDVPSIHPHTTAAVVFTYSRLYQGRIAYFYSIPGDDSTPSPGKIRSGIEFMSDSVILRRPSLARTREVFSIYDGYPYVSISALLHLS